MLPSSSSAARQRPRRGVFIGFTELAILLILLIVLCGVGYQSTRLKQRITSITSTHAAADDSSSKDPSVLSSRIRVLEHVWEWNRHVKAEGLTDQLILLGKDAGKDSAAALVSSPCPASSASGSGSGSGSKASSSCACQEPADSRWPMGPASEVEKVNPDLAAALKKHSKNNEIMLSLANGIMICKNTTICWWNGGNILESFLEIINHNKISNHLIGVMDDETEAYLKGRPYNYFRVNIVIPESQAKTHPANRVSTIKYTLLKQIIQMGYSALITDMDLVYLKNPFDNLHRDSDIEIQTDGFDDTSYGIIDSISDPSMGWGGGGLYMKLFTTNVGCMWVKANVRTYTLMSQVSDQLSKKSGWDQQVFNEYLLRPSHRDFQAASCSLRVMDYMKWTNSKIFFKSQRAAFLPGASSTAADPLMVHFNYHPDKHVRMLCIIDRYFKGNVSACDHFPPGSNPK